MSSKLLKYGHATSGNEASIRSFVREQEIPLEERLA